MSIKARIFLPLVLAGLLFMSGCSTTRIVTSWSDDTYTEGSLQNTLVIALTQKSIIRSRMEDEFTSHLRKMGAEAIQSYKSFPDLKDVKIETIKEYLLKNGLDSVLVIRLIDTKNETAYVPAMTTSTGGGSFGGYYGGYYGGYGGSSTTISSPGYIYDYKVFTIESNLYRAKDEKLIWSALTEAEEPTGTIDESLIELGNYLAADMKRHKLF